MSDQYFDLKSKLEGLGYNHHLPVDATPLVECILADLLQTTRSLQHYMDLSKDALKQRDSLLMEAEPYRCENARLIKENNKLHKEVMVLREKCEKIIKESTRKSKTMNEEISKKESTISKLQHDLRELSLRGLCADTLSSRNKSKKKETYEGPTSVGSTSSHRNTVEAELERKIVALEEQNQIFRDEITLLNSQINHRDSEIVRLNILLESKPNIAISKEFPQINSEMKIPELFKQLKEREHCNNSLKKELDRCLEKQHEAMLRALSLADKNAKLHEELKRMDSLALKVEEDCNKRMAVMMDDLNILQVKVNTLNSRNEALEKELTDKTKSYMNQVSPKLQETLNIVLVEKDKLQKEMKDLLEVNKNLQEKIATAFDNTKEQIKCPTKYELQKLLEEERKKYELNIIEIQTKLLETVQTFNNHLSVCKNKESTINKSKINQDTFLKHLQDKVCQTEQKILMLKKENEEYKRKMYDVADGNKQNYKDIISQLNAENADLSKENIALSQKLCQYMTLSKVKKPDEPTIDMQSLNKEINTLTQENQLLRKDKQEYNDRYKDALDTIEKLKRDLAYKQNDIERLEEENSSYKMTFRTGKASTEQLRDECHFLREEIKRMQSDVIKEKTLASQIKNIQIETERSSTEIQNELLSVQKQLQLSRDKVETLEKKCKDLQLELTSLKNDKSNLIDNIKKVDHERDKLVIELDHKTENICVLEQKLRSQTYEMNKLENEITELKRKFNLNKVEAHKLVDSESHVEFLNGEILRLQQKLDSAVIENKHLQNSLADANGILKLNKIEYEKSRKEVDGLKQQLQHYVAEIRRIEELLSQKEAERSDMLEHFASLSVEANILENTNHSLESESASKSQQLQSYISKIEALEAKVIDKDSVIDCQSNQIATLTMKVTSLENEIKLIKEEKVLLEHNVSHLKQLCKNLNSQKGNVTLEKSDTDLELRLYESKIRSLTTNKDQLKTENNELREKLATTENLLSNARREIVDLKLTLQDATSQNKALQNSVDLLSREQSEINETNLANELQLPLMLEDTLVEVSQEEDEDGDRYHEIHRRYSKYSHGSTL